MSNAFADIQTVYKTDYDYSSVNSNINFIQVDRMADINERKRRHTHVNTQKKT